MVNMRLCMQGLAVLTAIPPERPGYMSDRAALQRAVQRPTNAFEAFSRANEEVITSLLTACTGLFLDPARVRLLLCASWTSHACCLRVQGNCFIRELQAVLRQSFVQCPEKIRPTA